MKILIYGLGLPPFRRGGLVEYSVGLAEQLAENGNQVTFLYPGKIPLLGSKKCTFRKKKTNYEFNCYELINPLPVSLTFGNSVDVSKFYEYRSKDEIRRFISKVAPDIVHLHTIMGIPIQFLEVLKEKSIKIVYTTHDYYGLCPKMLSESPLEALASSKCTYDCMMCKVGPNIGKIKIMQSHLYQTFKNSRIFKYLRSKQKENFKAEDTPYTFNKYQVIKRYELRKYYLDLFSKVDSFHFNSSVAKEVFRQYLPNIKGKVVPLVIDDLKREKKRKVPRKEVKVGFLGGIDNKKGFFLLKKTLGQLYLNGMSFNVICAGSNTNDPFFMKNYVENLGIISKNEIKNFYNQIDLLVVPSLWHETFGLVVVEAITNNVPVICSDTVGAKDLIPSNYVFHDKKELFFKLKQFIMSVDTRRKAFSDFYNLEYDVNLKKHALVISKEFYH